jgi:hypothetical protein
MPTIDIALSAIDARRLRRAPPSDVILPGWPRSESIDAGRMGEGLVFGDQRGCGHLRVINPELSPGFGSETPGRPTSRIDQGAIRRPRRPISPSRARSYPRRKATAFGVKVAA